MILVFVMQPTYAVSKIISPIKRKMKSADNRQMHPSLYHTLRKRSGYDIKIDQPFFEPDSC